MPLHFTMLKETTLTSGRWKSPRPYSKMVQPVLRRPLEWPLSTNVCRWWIPTVVGAGLVVARPWYIICYSYPADNGFSLCLSVDLLSQLLQHRKMWQCICICNTFPTLYGTSWSLILCCMALHLVRTQFYMLSGPPPPPPLHVIRNENVLET